MKSGQPVGLHMLAGECRPMKRGMHRLVDLQVRTLGPGRHAHGGGLYLTVDLGQFGGGTSSQPE